MKIVQTAMLVIVAAITISASSRSMLASNEESIPAGVKTELDKKYPKWRLTQVNPSVHRVIEANPDLHGIDPPTIVYGDFNGDDLKDVGLLIDHEEQNLLIIAHQTESPEVYNVFQFSEWADYLSIWKKGKKAYDHKTGKEFVFSQNSVKAITFEKSARAYIFKDGKYYIAATSD